MAAVRGTSGLLHIFEGVFHYFCVFTLYFCVLFVFYVILSHFWLQKDLFIACFPRRRGVYKHLAAYCILLSGVNL